MKIKFIFAWYDLWVGAYWDRASRKLYVLPLPCLGVVIHFRRRVKAVCIAELDKDVVHCLSCGKVNRSGGQWCAGCGGNLVLVKERRLPTPWG